MPTATLDDWKERLQAAATSHGLTRWTLRGVVGGGGFYACLVVGQTTGVLLRLHAATVLGRGVGGVAVGLGSFAAVVAQDYVAHWRWRGVQVVLGEWGFLDQALEGSGWRRETVAGGLVVLGGTFLFWGLGGRFFRIMPSDYMRLGAFRSSHVVRATLEYAAPKTKGLLNTIGKVHGCHTCGTRLLLFAKEKSFIADHMPPVKVVKEANARWYRRWTGWNVKQHFYPQCSDCSQIQAYVVRHTPKPRPLRVHFTTFRAYHLAGVPLALLWGLIADASASVVV